LCGARPIAKTQQSARHDQQRRGSERKSGSEDKSSKRLEPGRPVACCGTILPFNAAPYGFLKPWRQCGAGHCFRQTLAQVPFFRIFVGRFHISCLGLHHSLEHPAKILLKILRENFPAGVSRLSTRPTGPPATNKMNHRNKMKKTIVIPSRCIATIATLAVLAAAFSPMTATAQVRGEGASKMIQLKPIRSTADINAVQAGDTVVMSCPKCTNTWVSVIGKPAKTGASPEKQVFQRHACPGCETKLITEGNGKQARDVIKHVCKNCGSEDAFCCVMKKGAAPTPGMDKK
jgi:hypothetical protein